MLHRIAEFIGMIEQHLHIAHTLVAEMKIIADHDHTRIEQAGKHIFNEIIRLHMRRLIRKRKFHQHIDAKVFHYLPAFLAGIDQLLLFA